MFRNKRFSALTAIFVGCLLLQGCGDGSSSENTSRSRSGFQANKATLEQASSGKLLAVSHSYTLLVPAKQIETVLDLHLAECRKLGCLVLESNTQKHSDGDVSAQLSLRLAPQAFSQFVEILTAAPVEVISHSQTAEDKTLPILDVEKRLDVKIALRDRLKGMLQDRSKSSLADLLAVEKELAQIQGDIEAGTAERDYLRTQTDTVKVDIRYSGIVAVPGGFDFSPVIWAWHNVGATVMRSTGSVISFIAFILPWFPVVFAGLWGLRRILRLWQRRKAS